MSKSETQRNACLSCRQRKLKCDRKDPCGNCQDRSVECKKQQFPSTSSRGIRKRQESPSTISHILSRLERIEAYIHREQGEEHADHSSSAVSPSIHATRDGGAIEANDSGTHRPDGDVNAILKESGQLVSLSANDNIILQGISHNLSVSVDRPFAAAPEAGNELQERYAVANNVQLPPKQETLRLFQIYLDYVGHFQHIIFEPHVRKSIEDVYSQLSHGPITIAPCGIILIFSILAIATVLAPLQGNLVSISSIMRDRLSVCAVYIRAAMDCLEQARRRMDHSLENVQGMVILSFLINHIEAFSARSRTLMAEAVAVARILNMHRVDATVGKREQPSDREDPIVLEIKRRVWWYLSATDWLVSLAAGFGDYTYTAPKKMAVNLPRHIDDSDLSKSNLIEQPRSQPTAMSYFLSRVRIAELVRNVSEVAESEHGRATYDLILSLDSKIEQLTEELPAFFQIKNTSSEQVRLIDKEYTYIPLQRLILTMMINLGRCKLHLPYLVGSTSQALHEFSRKTCLKSARTVLAAHQDMSSMDLSHMADFMKIQGTVHIMFMGTLILATDLCCNRPRLPERENQMSELMQACTMLANIKQHSQIAAKFLDSMTELLVKYGVWSPSVIIPTTNKVETIPNEDIPQQWQIGECSFDNFDMEQQEFDMLLVDDLWDTFVGRPAPLDMIDIL